VKKLPPTDQQRIIRNVRQHVKDKSEIDEVGERVRYGFQRDGFFHVFVQDPTVRVVARNGDQETVDLVMDVQEGEQYRLKDIQFTGSNEFPAAAMRAQFPLVDGDIFNREKIGEGLDALRKLYGSRGYINFTAVPETEEDAARRTVALIVDLDPGAVFHFGKLIVAGEQSQPGAREKLLATWKKHEGQVYDPAVLVEFLRELHARPQVKPEEVFAVEQDPDNHLAIVRIVLSPRIIGSPQ
jgi:outer membrane protein insertion porin family